MNFLQQFYLRSSAKYTNVVAGLHYFVHFLYLLYRLSVEGVLLGLKKAKIFVEFLSSVVLQELLLVFLFGLGCPVLESDIVPALRPALVKFESLL